MVQLNDHHGADLKQATPTAFLSINQTPSSIGDKASTPSTPSKGSNKPFVSKIIEDYLEVCPSEDIGGAINLPEPRVLIANARQLRKHPSEGSAAQVLSVFNQAVSVSVLYGSRAVPSSVWLDLTDAITSLGVACTMTISDISELLKLLATALHRCGRRINPHATSLSALADGARAAFKSREHSTDELLDFQSAVADVLRVVSLGGGAGTRSVERREWGQALATKLLPLLAVGTAAVYATYKTISADFCAEDSEHSVQNALFFAEALVTMPWCPTFTVPTEKLEAAGCLSKNKNNKKSSKRRSTSVNSSSGGWKRFFCLIPAATNTVSPSTTDSSANTTSTTSTSTSTTSTTISTTGSSLPIYSQLLSKITSRSVAIAQWLEETLAPAALHSMTLQQLDTFTAALVTAAGDDGKMNIPTTAALAPTSSTMQNSSSINLTATIKSSKYGVDSDKISLIRDLLVRCAGDAIEEAATRVINAGSCYSNSICDAPSSIYASSSSGDSPPTTPSATAISSHRLGGGNNGNEEFTFSTHSPPRPLTGISSTEEVVDVCSARRMAATARRNWEAAASVHSPKAADVANFALVLENYVAAREDEDAAAVQAEIAAAAARLELLQGC
jgi:hypothetical protein